MKKHLLLLFSILFASQNIIAQVYQNAESVEYDPINQQWLIANGGSIIADDGQGNLSFFTGSASHGMEVLGNTLYAIDNNVIRAYDLNIEAQIGMLSIPGVGFLNGMTTDGVSNIYVTDFSNRKIYKIDASDFNNLTYDEIVSNTETTPNGIVYDSDNNRLIFVNWGSNAPIKAVDLSDNSVSTIVSTNLGNIDGIDENNDGDYYIASWSPARISKFDKDFANPLEIITTPFINNPADIGYSLQTDTLAIPIGNDVVFVGFESTDTMTTSADNLNLKQINFKVYPNPVSQQSYIQFDLEKAAPVQLNILDTTGKSIRTLLTGNQFSGQHKVLFTGHQLPSGIYFCRLKINQKIYSQRIVIL